MQDKIPYIFENNRKSIAIFRYKLLMKTLFFINRLFFEMNKRY